jgi:holo-[acyl-carrier protein] synthase
MNVVGIGTHIIECLRIAQMIERHGELFVQRAYTAREIEYCSSRKAATQHYAGCWAGKEAVLKALGTAWVRGISWRDVEIVTGRDGRPTVLTGGAVRDLCQRQGIYQILISVAHCRSHATAYAMAMATPATEPLAPPGGAD